MHADDLGLLLELVRYGHGVGLTRKHFVQQMIAQGELVQLFDISLTSPPHVYYLVCQQKQQERPEVKTFIAWMRQTCSRI